jgi:hypothetical protein
MIIALNGKSGSGKDEIVKIIKSLVNLNVYHLSFAGKLREIVCHMYDWSNEPQLDKSIPDPYWSDLLGIEWSMRTALITIGESIRSSLSNHWISIVQHQINKISDIDTSIVIISDLRTDDELKFIRSLSHAKIWHVMRPRTCSEILDDKLLRTDRFVNITNNEIRDYDRIIMNNSDITNNEIRDYDRIIMNNSDITYLTNEVKKALFSS